MPLEIEDKFDVPVDFAMPDLSAVARVVGPKEYQLVALYFDTPDLRLAARGITLRRRRGGSDAGWHLKLPKSKGVRNEITHPLTRSAKVVPPELAELVLVYTRGAKLRPIAELDTRRAVMRLFDSDGEPLVEVADDRVKGTVLPQTGETPQVERWREVEAELLNGDESVLKQVAKRLRKAGAAPADAASKLGRLLGDRVPAPGEPKGESGTAGATVVGFVTQQVRALSAQDPRVRRAEDDAVHQARVACRRLRSAFKAFAPLLEGTESIQEELRWLGEVLGEVRDLEVIRARFAKHLDVLDESLIVGPIRRRLGDDLAAREDEGYDRIREAMSGERYYALLDSLDALVADPPFTKLAGKDADALEKIVEGDWKRVLKRYDRAQALPDLGERQLAMHDVRKAAKRARYTAEAVGMRGQAKRAETVQEVLGRHQDGVVAQELLADEAAKARTAGEDTFTYGVLAGIEHATAARADAEFPDVWAKVTS
ncbi:CYTH and CHAD domain-containing protein [Streptosporangiaceae bacterium NEAU-GS5]|nr:CYTH and CHAD domain-containing protein [Streptosporangiaceae bacterium NEAU-GS5]